MKVKPVTPENVRTEAKKIIMLDANNVDMIIERINIILITEAASINCGNPIKIHKDDLIRPNNNWKKQNIETVEAALKAFEKNWILTKNGKWEDKWCHIQFQPKPVKI